MEWDRATLSVCHVFFRLPSCHSQLIWMCQFSGLKIDNYVSKPANGIFYNNYRKFFGFNRKPRKSLCPSVSLSVRVLYCWILHSVEAENTLSCFLMLNSKRNNKTDDFLPQYCKIQCLLLSSPLRDFPETLLLAKAHSHRHQTWIQNQECNFHHPCSPIQEKNSNIHPLCCRHKHLTWTWSKHLFYLLHISNNLVTLHR